MSGRTIEGIVADCYDEWLKAGAALNKLNRGAEVDEMALLFDYEDSLEEFVHHAGVAGLINFNSVPRDTMVRQDKAQSFVVRFEFLQPMKHPFRIEAMTVISGDAPLHARRLEQSRNGCVVHASYKLGTLDEYNAETARLAEDIRVAKRAEYRNSYGMFSYWRVWEAPGIYLKPRVNLRDQSSSG